MVLYSLFVDFTLEARKATVHGDATRPFQSLFTAHARLAFTSDSELHARRAARDEELGQAFNVLGREAPEIDVRRDFEDYAGWLVQACYFGASGDAVARAEAKVSGLVRRQRKSPLLLSNIILGVLGSEIVDFGFSEELRDLLRHVRQKSMLSGSSDVGTFLRKFTDEEGILRQSLVSEQAREGFSSPDFRARLRTLTVYYLFNHLYLEFGDELASMRIVLCRPPNATLDGRTVSLFPVKACVRMAFRSLFHYAKDWRTLPWLTELNENSADDYSRLPDAFQPPYWETYWRAVKENMGK